MIIADNIANIGDRKRAQEMDPQLCELFSGLEVESRTPYLMLSYWKYLGDWGELIIRMEGDILSEEESGTSMGDVSNR